MDSKKSVQHHLPLSLEAASVPNLYLRDCDLMSGHRSARFLCAQAHNRPCERIPTSHTPLRSLLFEAGLVKDTKVSDALASWRRAEIRPEMLPRFRHLNCSTDVPGREQVITLLNTLGANVAACLIENKQMILYDSVDSLEVRCLGVQAHH